MAAVDGGLVSAREHPSEPLVIYNYTAECQYKRAWNDCTRQCRGLIATTDGEVVARPFPKFFNYGEPDAPELDLLTPARVTDKLDGSLGVLYPTTTGHAIATRGSFISEQAIQATVMLQPYLEDGWQPLPGVTYLFEILYPENRIVVNYGDRRDLVLLTSIHTLSGLDLGPDGSVWPGPRADVLPYGSLAEALLAPPRPNAEGMVILVGLNDRIKLKQWDYVELHRIVTGLSARVVWEQIGDGKTVEEIKAPLPEEFAQWVDDVASNLLVAADQTFRTACEVCESIVRQVGRSDRKAFALEAQKEEELRPYLFMILDGKDPWPAIWKSLKPAGNWTPRDFEEAA